MKTSKKCLSLLLAFAVTIGCLAVPSINAQAASPKTDTYIYDAKNGVCYESAVRTGIASMSANRARIYLENYGDYIAEVKSGNKKLVSRVVESDIPNEQTKYGRSSICEAAKGKNFQSFYSLDFFAYKPGVYTVKVTIKNSAKKTTCTKKIKVYATELDSPCEYISYAGKRDNSLNNSFCSKKASGKLKVSANKTYKLKDISLGTIQSDGTITYKKIKNGAKITLSDSTVYTENISKYDFSHGNIINKSEYGESYDFLLPVTPIRVTFYDTKLKITIEEIYYIYKLK